jgi:hypothetical protein
MTANNYSEYHIENYGELDTSLIFLGKTWVYKVYGV